MMAGVIFLVFVFFGINQLIIGYYQKKHAFFSKRIMNLLYFYHVFFFGVYLWYARNNPSDSKAYYDFLVEYTGTWLDTFGTDTKFINFLSYPFYQLGFSYEMLMFTFSWMGFLGFVYAYLFFRKNIPIKIKVFKKIDFLTLVLFFPNMHFWTASLGKGAPIFLGLMMFTYAIGNPKNRTLLLVLSSVIIFYIRPHVFLFVAVGTVVGYFTGQETVSFGRKILISAALLGTLFLVQDKILAVVNLQDSENLVEGFDEFAEVRSEDLSEGAGSGVNMNSYSLPFKFFTFWFRPLFIDAPNFLGIIISFENLIYLLLFLKIIKPDFLKFIKKAPSMVKMSLVIFLLTSFAMTFVMSNLGIIMRQKSMVMYYIFFVIYYYLAKKKYDRIVRVRKLKLIRKHNLENEQKVLT